VLNKYKITSKAMRNNDQKTPTVVATMSATEVTTVSSSTITFYLEDGTADAGSAAGTIVIGRLGQAPILNQFGDRIGEYSGSSLSTSIVFTSGGAMIGDQEKGFVYDADANQRITKTAAKLTVNGDWACDYLTGLFIIKKATTGTTQAITSYLVRTGGGGGTSSNPSEIQGVDADNAPATANPVIVAAEYNSLAPTYANGDASSLQGDINGNLKTVGQYMPVAEKNAAGDGYYAISRWGNTNSTDKGTEYQNYSFQTINVKATAGSVTKLTVINTTASVRYIQIHNTATTPSASAVPAISFMLAANGSLNLGIDQLGQNGFYCATGIAIANSSAAGIYTAGVAGDLLVNLTRN